jgi:hypothetical protein
MKFALALLVGFSLLVDCDPATAQPAPAAPAAMISNFRRQHGEGPVTLDPKLNQIAHEQAAAMASKDVLDHGVLGPFGSRVASAGFERAAENIAYGYDDFPRTLDQWIKSPEHRKNLLMPRATRVGIATVKSSKTHRPYWAMAIAVEEKRPPTRPKERVKERTIRRPTPACRIKILGLCL